MTTTSPLLGPAWRRAALLVTPIGPLAIAALRWLLPYDTTDDPVTVAAKVAAHPVAQSAVLWLGLVALVTLPLGVLVVGAAAVRARPVLGAVGAVVAWVGFAQLAFLVGSDQVALAGVEAGVPSVPAAAVLAASTAHPVSTVATTAWVAGHILGVVLLGVALWRTVPVGAVLALIVSQPLHLVFAVVVPNQVLDGLAWLLTAVGFAVTAVVGLPARPTTPTVTRVRAATGG